MGGGIGNQLFKIAVVYAISKKYGYTAIFPDTWTDKPDREPIWQLYSGFLDINSILKRIPFLEYSCIPWYSIYEQSFSFSPIQTLENGHMFYKLNGYYQSSRYFLSYSDEIRQLLQIPEIHRKNAMDYMSSIHIHNPDGWIGAHVRRGDYLDAAEYHCVTSKEYFKRARSSIAERIGPRTVCWISEDLEWVYKNVYENGDTVIHSDAITDFTCLSLFRHIIMSNSTFSWWATWLNPNQYTSREICCPDRWFASRGPQDYESIYEPEWRRISTISG